MQRSDREHGGQALASVENMLRYCEEKKKMAMETMSKVDSKGRRVIAPGLKSAIQDTAAAKIRRRGAGCGETGKACCAVPPQPEDTCPEGQICGKKGRCRADRPRKTSLKLTATERRNRAVYGMLPEGMGRRQTPLQDSDWTFGRRFEHCTVDADECSKAAHANDLKDDTEDSVGGAFLPEAIGLGSSYGGSKDVAAPWKRSDRTRMMSPFARGKLMPGEYCHNKATCERHCVDPTNFGRVRALGGTFLKVSVVPGLHFGRGWFCFDVKDGDVCEVAKAVLRDANGAPCVQLYHRATGKASSCKAAVQCRAITASCVNGICDASGGNAKDFEEVRYEGRSITVPPRVADCLGRCTKKQVCSGGPGMGLQQLTRFEAESSTALPQLYGNNARTNGRAKGANKYDRTDLAGSFHLAPTSPWETRVFATGKCYECKVGVDGHFRCPVKGRRLSLLKREVLDLLPAMGGGKGGDVASDQAASKEVRGRVTELLHLALYGGADMCFDVPGSGPVDGIKTRTLASDRTDAIDDKLSMNWGEGDEDDTAWHSTDNSMDKKKRTMYVSQLNMVVANSCRE